MKPFLVKFESIKMKEFFFATEKQNKESTSFNNSLNTLVDVDYYYFFFTVMDN